MKYILTFITIAVLFSSCKTEYAQFSEVEKQLVFLDDYSLQLRDELTGDTIVFFLQSAEYNVVKNKPSFTGRRRYTEEAEVKWKNSDLCEFYFYMLKDPSGEFSSMSIGGTCSTFQSLGNYEQLPTYEFKEKTYQRVVKFYSGNQEVIYASKTGVLEVKNPTNNTLLFSRIFE